ncbi:hypothetical protein [Streptomyces sp. CA-106110]|uniref:hypothetical protein n=1 Tax=Streptomyces sp. CA-106110 TaxID=3240044 RepID=UPI003D8D8D60
MKTSNMDGPRPRMVRYLRKWAARHGRTVQEQLIRGAAYSLGSGAVSLLMFWVHSLLVFWVQSLH